MKIIIGIVIVVLVSLGGLLLLQSDAPAVQDSIPSTVLIDHSTGEEVILSELGGFLVVNSWATWCPFCVQEVPDFVELQKEFKTISVVLVNRKEKDEKVEVFLEGRGVSLTDLVFLQDAKDNFYKSIGGFSMPETLFVKDGNVIFHKRGFMDLSEMRDLTNKLIDGTL